MADTEWIDNIRRIVLRAMEAENPCDVILGSVTKAAPLEIQISDKAVLNASQILIPQSMTDHTQEMSIPGVGTVNVMVKNALKAEEQVLLMQKRGGQLYVVLDRWQKGG